MSKVTSVQTRRRIIIIYSCYILIDPISYFDSLFIKDKKLKKIWALMYLFPANKDGSSHQVHC